MRRRPAFRVVGAVGRLLRAGNRGGACRDGVRVAIAGDDTVQRRPRGQPEQQGDEHAPEHASIVSPGEDSVNCSGLRTLDPPRSLPYP